MGINVNDDLPVAKNSKRFGFSVVDTVNTLFKVLRARNISGDYAALEVVPYCQGTLTNGSGSITTGGTSQQIFASKSDRRYLLIQNISTENLWFNFGTAAVQDQPSIKLLPNASFVMESNFVDTQAVNIIGATTGSKFVAKEG